MGELTAIALWMNTVFAGFDEKIATAIHRLFEIGGGFFTPFFSFISFLGLGGIVLILLSICLMLFKKTRRYGVGIGLALAFGTIITNAIFKPLVARPRPFSWEGSIFQRYWIELGRHMETDKSFPSGHMTAAFEAALGFFLQCKNKRKAWLVFFFPLLMGISRIYLGVHYASDVLGGILAGGLGALCGFVAIRFLPQICFDFTFDDIINWMFHHGPFPLSKKIYAVHENTLEISGRHSGPARETPRMRRGEENRRSAAKKSSVFGSIGYHGKHER